MEMNGWRRFIYKGLLEARVAKTTSTIYHALGKHEKAEKHQRRCESILVSLDKGFDEETALITRLAVEVAPEIALARASEPKGDVLMTVYGRYSEGLHRLAAKIPNFGSLAIVGRHAQIGFTYYIAGKYNEAKSYLEKGVVILERCCLSLTGFKRDAQLIRALLRKLEQRKTPAFDEIIAWH